MDGCLVEPRILDGDGGLGGEEAEECVVLLGESLLFVRGGDVHHPDEFVVEEQWFGDAGHKP